MKKRRSILFILLIILLIVIAGVHVYRSKYAKAKEKPIVFAADLEEETVPEPKNLNPKLKKHLEQAHTISKDEIHVGEAHDKEAAGAAQSVADASSGKETESLSESESEDTDKVIVDLIIFAGQSNMSGFGGNPAQAPPLTEGAGGEFRAISNPTSLYTITEPFGFYENTPIMNDMLGKGGTLVTSFVNAFYEETGIPVVAVSASKCGTSSNYWASEAVCKEVIMRYRTAYDWLNANGYQVKNKFIVFLQGENDVIENVTLEQYLTNMNTFSTTLYNQGIDKFFMIRVGRKRSDATLFDGIIETQTKLCQNDPRFVLASTVLNAYQEKDMVDEYHYTQQVLNDVGEDAGKNVGYFANTWKEPEMYDYKYQNQYVPKEVEP